MRRRGWSRPPARRRASTAAARSRTSNALDTSSKTNSSDALTNMRAAAARCTWPPDSRTPRGPTRVSNPSSRSSRSLLHHRGPDGAVQVDLRFGQSQQDVAPQRLAEQPRRLRHVGAPRRDEKLGRLVDGGPVPPDLAGLYGHRADDRPHQRGLARADPSGDDGEVAAPPRSGRRRAHPGLSRDARTSAR